MLSLDNFRLKSLAVFITPSKYMETGLYPRSRLEFKRDAAKFIARKRFDGLDLYWGHSVGGFVFVDFHEKMFSFKFNQFNQTRQITFFQDLSDIIWTKRCGL